MQHHPNRLSGAFDGLAIDNGRTATLSQQQIQAEIHRFESVHPRIYQIYDLLKKVRVIAASDQSKSELIEQIQEQVIGIEDAFVNSQEWTIGRSIHEIRVGVIGSEDSCKNSLIHYFLTRNWNWEDAPEGGRFKKEVFIDGLSYLLLIRDEGSREPNIQFAHWFDALLIVFAIESHQSFNAALELHKKVHHFRPLDSGDVPVYLIGMRNMSQMAQKRAINESDAQRMSKLLKMANSFECADGSNVLRTFNSVCQRIVQQRGVFSRQSSSFIGGNGHDFDKCSSAGAPSYHRYSGHYHQRSVSVLPLNNDQPQQQSSLFAPTSSFPLALGTTMTAARSRTPRHDVVGHAVPCSSSSYHNNNISAAIFHAPQSSANSNFRPLNSYASFTPNTSSNNILEQNSRRRESVDHNWPRPVAAVLHHHHLPNQQQQVSSSFMATAAAMPSTPSSALGGGARCAVVEPLTSSTISPAFSHNNLSTAAALYHHKQQHNNHHTNNNNNNNAMSSSNLMVAASPYTRSASSVIPLHATRYGTDQQHGFYADGSAYNNTLVDSGGGVHGLHALSTATSSSTLVVNLNNNNGTSTNGTTAEGNNVPTTPGSTPNTQRKQHRRISNIFRKDNLHTPEERIAKSSADINLGVGRAIPVKQDYLYKKSKNGLNREWKKKYVCLYSDGRICYHQNLKEYAEKDSRGKEIYLGLATVRTSDRHRPKCGGGGGAVSGGSNSNRNSLLTSTTTTAVAGAKDTGSSPLLHDRSNEASISNAEDGGYFCPHSPIDIAGADQQQQLSDCVSDNCGDVGAVAIPPSGGASTGISGGAGSALATSTSSSLLMDGGGIASNCKDPRTSSTGVTAATANNKHNSGGKKEKQKEKKKRAKRIGSSGKNDEDDECCEFEVVSCDQKRWEFSARSVEERDEWVSAIEREIERCLQQQLSLKDQQQMGNNGRSTNGCGVGKSNGSGVCGISSGSASFTARSERSRMDIRALRRLPGNDKCADCGSSAPDWAAINFGTLICIECSGIHRMLGSHISKVRSLELDDWPPEHLAVMQAIGNAMANRIWQHNSPEREKPTPESSREQKEQSIRTIYVKRLYLPSIPVDRTLHQQLVEAVLGRKIEQLLAVLPRCEKDDVNAPIDTPKDHRTVVHLACGIGAPEILQLLIWYNADLRSLDDNGRNALWHANISGSAECAAILIQQGGLQSEQKQPLQQQQRQKYTPTS